MRTREQENKREREEREVLTDLEAVSKLLASLGELSAAKTSHAPRRPDDAGVQLTLGGDLHGQLKLVFLHEAIPDPSRQLWLGQLLDRGYDAGTRGHQPAEEVHSTQVPVSGCHVTVR